MIVYPLHSQMLFRKYGWNKKTFYFPYYRQVQKRSNMDNYSSKGSTVWPQKKMHHAALQLTAVGGDDDGNCICVLCVCVCVRACVCSNMYIF